ncbi:hypothetical protein NEOKW01_0767 [Nematocida sp. AWRm80]|nr:hypothetical protein NEOKW01_0767 [Nematocida sp. AWRm80]
MNIANKTLIEQKIYELTNNAKMSLTYLTKTPSEQELAFTRPSTLSLLLDLLVIQPLVITMYNILIYLSVIYSMVFSTLLIYRILNLYTTITKYTVYGVMGLFLGACIMVSMWHILRMGNMIGYAWTKLDKKYLAIGLIILYWVITGLIYSVVARTLFLACQSLYSYGAVGIYSSIAIQMLFVAIYSIFTILEVRNMKKNMIKRPALSQMIYITSLVLSSTISVIGVIEWFLIFFKIA